ncbi:MAG: hypothetical protein GY810_02150 [Aureispira sp.]|nr:hypothetical protein [Aureispira sp.]
MKKGWIKILAIGVIVILLLVLDSAWVEAQCPMCKMSAEADLENGGTAGRGLNKGIIYLLVFPYILMGGLGFLWWRHSKQVAELEQGLELRALLEAHDPSAA